MKHFVFMALLLALVSTNAFGQATGTLGGTVQDPTGALIPGVEVVAVNDATGVERQTISNETGAYTFAGSDTILQLLTRAGGLSPFADRDNIRIVRRDATKIIEYIVDYDAILKGDLKQDILLRPGDRIIIP